MVQSGARRPHRHQWRADDDQPPLTATDSSSNSQWSDWNGQLANSSPAVTAAFNAAVAKVSTVGLSFGGGCFFENGLTTSDGSGTFTSIFSESFC